MNNDVPPESGGSKAEDPYYAKKICKYNNYYLVMQFLINIITNILEILYSSALRGVLVDLCASGQLGYEMYETLS